MHQEHLDNIKEQAAENAAGGVPYANASGAAERYCGSLGIEFHGDGCHEVLAAYEREDTCGCGVRWLPKVSTKQVEDAPEPKPKKRGR